MSKWKGLRPQAWDMLMCVQLCPTLCDSMDWSPPISSVHGNVQARIPEWVALSYSGGSSRPRDRTCISCFAGILFTAEPPGTLCANSHTDNNYCSHPEQALQNSGISVSLSIKDVVKGELQPQRSLQALPVQEPETVVLRQSCQLSTHLVAITCLHTPGCLHLCTHLDNVVSHYIIHNIVYITFSLHIPRWCHLSPLPQWKMVPLLLNVHGHPLTVSL